MTNLRCVSRLHNICGLLEKLMGTDLSEAYMMDLKKLCLRGENIVLVHDLGEAMVEAKISLLRKLWREIDSRLRKKIPDLPDKSEDSDITEDRIRRFVTNQTYYNYHGLYFQLDQHATLKVDVEDWIYFGVHCKHGPTRRRYADLGASFSGWERSDNEFPLYRYPSIDLNLKRTGQRTACVCCQVKKLGKAMSRTWCLVSASYGKESMKHHLFQAD